MRYWKHNFLLFRFGHIEYVNKFKAVKRKLICFEQLAMVFFLRIPNQSRLIFYVQKISNFGVRCRAKMIGAFQLGFSFFQINSYLKKRYAVMMALGATSFTLMGNAQFVMGFKIFYSCGVGHSPSEKGITRVRR